MYHMVRKTRKQFADAPINFKLIFKSLDLLSITKWRNKCFVHNQSERGGIRETLSVELIVKLLFRNIPPQFYQYLTTRKGLIVSW